MLSRSQKAAITHGTGPLLVIAGPGSGKTHTITNRISYLIHTLRIPPEQILVITFTREAALSMQRRLCEQEADQGSYHNEIIFGTFHSVFYHILKQSGTISHQKLLTDSQRTEIAFQIIKPYTGREQSADERMDLAKGLLSAISYYKNTGDEILAAQKAPGDLQAVFGDLIQAYEDRKSRVGIEYDDMLYACLRLLQKDKGLLDYWQRRFSHILVDEFQDINPLQYEILKLLGKGSGNIFVVGDDDQAIYGFRGAYPELMHEFLKDYEKGASICLEENYRSSQIIVESAGAVIGENKLRFDKKIRALRKGQEGDVKIYACETPEEEYEGLIGRLKERESDWDQCGILFRTNMRMQDMAGRLRKAGIPFSMKGAGECRYTHGIVRDMNAYMKLALGEGQREDFLRIMNRPSRWIRREAVGEWKNHWENLHSYYKNNNVGSDRKQDTYYREGVLKNIETLKQDLVKLAGMPPYLALQYLYRKMDYAGYLKQAAGNNTDRWCEYQDIFQSLLEEARGYSDWREWWKEQDLAIWEYQEEKRRMGNKRSDAENKKGDAGPKQSTGVHLMTVHSAKGLEFDHVILPDVNEGVYPYGRMPDSKTVEEERRLLYVAMTRAKNTLDILCLTGTREHPRYPSRFLKPIYETYQSSSTNSSNSAESRNSSKASATFSYSVSSSINPSSGSSLGSSGFSL